MQNIHALDLEEYLAQLARSHHRYTSSPHREKELFFCTKKKAAVHWGRVRLHINLMSCVFFESFSTQKHKIYVRHTSDVIVRDLRDMKEASDASNVDEGAIGLDGAHHTL